MTLDTATIQSLITKLDLNTITVKYAKEWLLRWKGIAISGRTKAQVIKEIGSYAKTKQVQG